MVAKWLFHLTKLNTNGVVPDCRGNKAGLEGRDGASSTAGRRLYTTEEHEEN
jgi:hypothetical protein